MLNRMKIICIITSLSFAPYAWGFNGQEAAAPSPSARPDSGSAKNISEFLIDKDAGQISASSIVGVNNSLITNIQSSQDVVLAFRPNDSESKDGFGISITPARTSITPMPAGKYYSGGVINRLLGSLTISYASKGVEIANSSVNKRAISFDTFYYFDEKTDPVIAGFDALQKCVQADAPWQAMQKNAVDMERASFEENTKKYSAALQTCLDDMKKALPWNSARISFAFGSGEISGDGIRTQSIGNAFVINGMLPLGNKGALQPVYRRTWNELDLASLNVSPRRGRSNLFASRFTYGLQDAGKLQLLVEISNLKKNTLVQSESFFKNAIGLDYAITKGIWLQLRYGNSKNRTGDAFERKGLLALQFNPSCALSDKCGK